MYLFNTLSGTKEKFTPLEPNHVRLYSCGPTVYDYAHIGNFRSFLFSDLLSRTLRYAGYNVTNVQNITDVGHLTNDDSADGNGEDKIQKKARTQHKDPYQIVQYYTEAFLEDEHTLRILPPSYRPKATEYIPHQIALIQSLIQKGHAYHANGSVYFSTKTFPQYGALSKNNLESLQAGIRIDVHSDKKDPLDFALWKRAETSHLMQWDFETGRRINPEDIESFQAQYPTRAGFPGWHIECSAMSQALLGHHFDIHTGGEDNIFPHHECEIAQNECSHHGQKSVNYWMHAKHLLVDGKKMSKSDGNFYTIRDLVSQGWKGEEIRYALLSAHYKTSLNFSLSLLQQSRSSIERIREAYRIFSDISISDTTPSNFTNSYKKTFQTALFDDLNTALALSAVFDCIRVGLQKRDQNQLSPHDAQSIVTFLKTDFDSIFDVLTTRVLLSEQDKSDIETQLQLRTQARQEKNWAESDRIRDALTQKYNIDILDETGHSRYKVR